MFIPLENLYGWISSLSQDIVIYRFFPHGSKNLNNIAPVDDSSRQKTSWEILRMPVMLCHDQEILDFSRFENLDWEQVRDLVKSKWTFVNEPSDAKKAEEFWRDRANYNLACMVNNGINDRVILLHSELNSDQVRKFDQSKFVTAYWWSHGMISRDWYRYAQYDARLVNWPIQYPLDFNIYSRAWSGTREYRLYFLQTLIQQNLHDVSRITFADTDEGQRYHEYQFSNPQFNNITELSKLKVDNSVPGTSSATYDPQHYRQCAIDVVLETLYDDQRWHLTEKVLRPIACGKPFVLVSTPGSLKYLQGYGFETFSPWIDESYDDVVDPQQRVHALVKTLKEFSDLDPTTKQKHLESMLDIAKRNQEWFFSDEFAQLVKQELIDNVYRARLTVRDLYQTGQSYRANRLRMTRDDKQRMEKTVNQWHASADARQEAAKLLRECRSRLPR